MMIFNLTNQTFLPASESSPLAEGEFLITTQEELNAISAAITGGGAVWEEDGKLKTSGKAPSPYHEWHNGKWQLSKTKQAEQLEATRAQLIDSIDNRAAEIAAHWLRFAEEYKEREAAAMTYRDAGFEGEPSIYITSFSTVAKIPHKAAAELILQQAEGLRELQKQLAVQRMRKYELKNPKLTLEQLEATHKDIITKMQQLAEAHQ